MYIKQKKVWTNKFESDQLARIWEIFQLTTPTYTSEWNEKTKSMFTTITERYGNFIHPETDIRDDSVGIQPKQILKWIKKYPLDSLENLLFILDHKLRVDLTLNQRFTDEDSFIAWKLVWKTYVDPIVESNTADPAIAIGMITKSLFSINKNTTNEALKDLGMNPWLAYFIQDKNWADRYIIDNEVNKESFSNFFFDKKTEWKSVNITPRSLIMLCSRSERFSRDSLKTIELLFGSKQIAQFPLAEQYAAVTLIDFFGKSLNSISIDILKKGKLFKKVGLSSIPDLKEAVATKMTESLIKIGYNPNTEQYANYSMVLPALGLDFIKNLTTEENQVKLTESLDLYIELEQKNEQDTEFKDFVLTMNPRWLKYISRYSKHKVTLTQLRGLFNIYKQRSNRQALPNLKGKCGSYQYELVDKTNNKEALFLGYATDCCQVFGGVGETCLISGYKNPEESFIIIKKKGKVFAQSWIWWSVDNEGKKFLTIDSMEVLGKDLEEMPDIMESYLEISRALVAEHGFDYVITGADGQTIPNGLKKYSQEKISYEEMQERGITYKGQSTYTDIKELGIFILDLKKKNLKDN